MLCGVTVTARGGLFHEVLKSLLKRRGGAFRRLDRVFKRGKITAGTISGREKARGDHRVIVLIGNVEKPINGSRQGVKGFVKP